MPGFKTTIKEHPNGWLLVEVAEGDKALSDLEPYWREGDSDLRRRQGSALWELTFHNTLSDELHHILKEIKSRGLSPKLAFNPKTDGLRTLDWESLYDPAKGHFLLEDPDLQIYRFAKADPVGPSRISIPARAVFITLRSSANSFKKDWLETALASLVEVGSLQYEIIEAASMENPQDASIQLFHLFVETSDSLIRDAHNCRAWLSKSKPARNVWDRIRACLPQASLGVISFVSLEDPARSHTLLEKLQEKRWPFFCRMDLAHLDLQEELAVKDLYSSIASGSQLPLVQNHQLALDSRKASRIRTIHFFSAENKPIYCFNEIDRYEDSLQSFLRSTITSVEEFYKWERMYAQLIFSTRLRLQKIDLSDVEDLRYMEEKIFNLSEALSEFDRLVIIGEPGTGKTTACKRAAWELAKRAYGESGKPDRAGRPRIPIYLALKKLSGPSESAGNSLLEHISRQLFDGVRSLELQERLKTFLLRHQLVLLLDGLNEVSPPSRRRAVIEEIIGLQEQHRSSIKIVVTSRKHDFDVVKFRRQAAFEVLEIVELSPGDIRKFAKCYLFEDASVAQFVATLNRQLQAAARNPLILRLLLDCFKQGQSLIGSRAQLLDRFCRQCLENPCEALGGPTGRQVARKEMFLTLIAFKAWSAGFSLRMSLDDCLPLAAEVAGDETKGRSMINEIAENGLVSIGVDEEGREFLDFQYQSYHEYFSARRVAAIWSEGKKRQFRALLRQTGWHEIIALAAGAIEMERKKLARKEKNSARDLSERDLIDYLKKKREIILAGMCVWNMEGMQDELRPFERWLVDRAHAACLVLTRVSIYSLFFVVLPIWLISIFLATAFGRDYEYYVFQFRGFRFGTTLLVYVGLYALVPLFLYFCYKRFSLWIASRQESLVLRPSLAALYFIGSTYARASIIDLFNNRDIASSLDSSREGVTQTDPTRATQRTAFKSLIDHATRYRPEDLLELVNSDAHIADISMLARVVAKDFSSSMIRSLAAMANLAGSPIAHKAYQAGKLVVKVNMELREEWLALVEGRDDRELPVTKFPRGGFLKGIIELFITSSGRQKAMIVASVIIATVTIYAFVTKDWKLLIVPISGIGFKMLEKMIEPYLTKKKSLTYQR